MAAGMRASMAFGATRIAPLVRLLQAVSRRLGQSLKTAKQLSVLLLWLPRVVSVFSEGLRRRLQVAMSLLRLSLLPMAPRLLVLRLQLQQAASGLLLGLLRLLRRALRRLLPTSSPTRRRVLRLLLRLRAGVALFRAQALRRLKSLRLPLQAKSNGKKKRVPVPAGQFRALHQQTLQNNRRPVRPGSKQRED